MNVIKADFNYEPIMNRPISALNLGPRIEEALWPIKTIKDLCSIPKKKLISKGGIGKRSFEYIHAKLNEIGLQIIYESKKY